MAVALLTCVGLVRYLSTGRGTRHKWLCPNQGVRSTKFAERLRMCGGWGGGTEKLWLVPYISTYWCGTILIIF